MFKFYSEYIGYASFIISVFFTLHFSSCKKGSEDPFFSIYSRKSRVAGEWVVHSYNKEQTTTYAYPSGQSGTQSFTQNFGLVDFSQTTNGNLTSFTQSGKISQATYHFDKSGNWSSILEYYLYAPQAVGGFYVSKYRVENDGVWEFQGKQDGLKNKESMLLTTYNSKQFYYTYSSYMGTIVDSLADSSLTLYSGTDKQETWKLIGLSNTRINAEISSAYSYTSTVSGIAGTKVTSSDLIAIELKQ